MDKNTVTLLIIAGLALLIWVPAIIWSVRRVLKGDNKKRKQSK